MLFEDINNFTFDNMTNLLTIILRVVVKNRVVEKRISLQLNSCNSEVSQDFTLSSEITEELKNLKMTVLIMEKKI